MCAAGLVRPIQRSCHPEAVSTTAQDAIRALQTRGLAYDALVDDAPRRPGLYAFWADPSTLAAMAWDVPFEGKPLYVGKSESSLNSRDVTTHFGTGKTGWSTVRRSLAVVLRDELRLASVPRNATLPVRPANYGLTPDGEERLTAWMKTHLTIAMWVKPVGIVLKPIETDVIKHWQPPLNLDKVDHPSKWLSNGRKAFADDVRRQTGLIAPG